MDSETGKLYTREEMEKLPDDIKMRMFPISAERLTKKQIEERCISLHDNRSFAGKARIANKIGRNDPCPCGSGKKYKKCCLHRKE